MGSLILTDYLVSPLTHAHPQPFPLIKPSAKMIGTVVKEFCERNKLTSYNGMIYMAKSKYSRESQNLSSLYLENPNLKFLYLD